MDKYTTISVLIVNYNTYDFVKLSLYALSHLTDNSFHVYLCDNGSQINEKKKIEQLKNDYKNISIFFRQQSTEGSMGHGEALDFLLAKIHTPYTVILDADCILLYKGWDQLLIKELRNNIAIAGTPPVSIQSKKPHDFPLMYAIIFETNTFKKLNISMTPDKKQISMGLDTGYQMREKFLNAGLSSFVLKCISTRTDQSGPFGKITFCAEYYHPEISNIITCHFGRGSSKGAAKFNSVLFRIPFIGNFLKSIRSTIDKKRWITKCYQIVNNQKKY